MIDLKDAALIIVDMQNDFITGSLAVPEAETIIKPIENLICMFGQKGLPVIWTQDWHHKFHVSFASAHSEQPFTVLKKTGEMVWPDHCVRNTFGAEIHEALQPNKFDYFNRSNTFLVKKGTSIDYDSYSAFYSWGSEGDGDRTGLTQLLNILEITTVLICGLATDYCVKATAIDARRSGFETYVIRDCCKGVTHDSTQEACRIMMNHGVCFCGGAVI